MHLASNLILNTDSYKASHWLQYPPGVDATFFYLESRGGDYERTLFFGLQSILKEYLSQPVTAAMIDEARAFFPAHGEPFHEAGCATSSMRTVDNCRCASARCRKARWCRRIRH